MNNSTKNKVTRPPGYDALIQAIAYFDNSQANLARALSEHGTPVSSMTVTHWKVRAVPLDRCRDLEAVTDGKIPREAFRPDHFRLHIPQSGEEA
jgi:DNA-binding transcriptional regulator YdaS (Cro superfamily)